MSEIPAFLSGGGQMGELIRSIEWSETLLGHPNGWPQPLRTAVRIMLDSPFGMYIAWGEDYIQLYNDSFRPILGATKHPQAMGNNSSVTFGEIWPTIDPMFEGVMQGTPVGFPDFHLQLDRNGFLEDCVFDFSYSPIRLENGEVGGVLVIVIETTEKVRALKALKESEQQLTFAIEAAGLGTWDLNPATNKFRGNSRLKEWFGLKPDDEIELPLALAVIADDDRENVNNAIQTALDFSSGGYYNIVYSIIHPQTKKERIVHAKGQASFNDEGIAYRFNGTLQDVTDEITSRRLLIDSEQKFRRMVEQAPVAMCVYRGRSFIIEVANEKFIELGDRSAEQVIGKPLFEAFPEVVYQGFEQALNAVYTSGLPVIGNELSLNLIRGGKLVTIHLNFVYNPIYDPDGTISGIVAVGNEVTEQVKAHKKIEEGSRILHNFFMQVPAALCILKGPLHIFEFANPEYMQMVGTNRDIIGKPVREALPDIEGQGFYELLDTVFESGVPFIAKEIPAQLDKGNGKLESIYINLIYQVLADVEGNTEGILVLAYDVSDMVLSRQKVAESKERLQAALNASQTGTFRWNIKTNEMLWDENLDRLFGLIPGQTVQNLDDFIQIVHSDDQEKVIEACRLCADEGADFDMEFRIIWPDGTQHWLDDKGKTFVDADGMPQYMTGACVDITERKRSEEELERAEEQFRTVTQTVPQLIWTSNKEGLVDFFNQQWYDYTGSTPEESFGNGWARYIHPEQAENLFATWQNSLKTGEPILFEFQLKGRDENFEWFYVTANPIRDDNGIINKWLGTLTNINERKAWEDELKRFKHMADNAMDPFILMREDGSFAYLNDIALECWDFTREEIAHIKVPDVDPNYNEEAFTGLFNAAQNEKIPQFETLHKRKDGTVFPVEVNVGGLTLGGNPHLFAVARDISERKKSEDTLKYRKALLEAQNEAIPDAILIVDTKGSILSYNQNFITLWQIPKEIIDRKDDTAALQFAMKQLIDPQAFIERVNYCYAHPEVVTHEEVLFIDGRTIERYGNGVLDEDGTSYGWAWYFRDITELKELEKQKDDFISMASHELKTPVSSLKGYSQILYKKSLKEGNTSAVNLLSRMNNQINKLTYLISDLLEATKASSGQLTYQEDIFDFNILVTEIVDEVQQTTQNHQLDVYLDGPSFILGDRNRIGQVIINLLSNAVKYSPTANKVLVTTKHENENIIFSVQDFGFGIPKEKQEHIFDRFFRVSSAMKDNISGLGLGLYIASEIIKRHNGIITVKSDEGQGSIFIFKLPVIKKE
ncbi:PAS domain S-box protein [Daejeonella sp.]|uniref:PAS domain S-box protein n=1 Tax=Daejeonella sp. TaxID=2805397 RepID=UPI0030C56B41